MREIGAKDVSHPLDQLVPGGCREGGPHGQGEVIELAAHCLGKGRRERGGGKKGEREGIEGRRREERKRKG